MQLKTRHERNSERLLRQGSKWEKERSKYDEIDRMYVEELQEKKRRAEREEADYAESNRQRGMDLLRCEFKLKTNIRRLIKICLTLVFNPSCYLGAIFHNFLIFMFYQNKKSRLH